MTDLLAARSPGEACYPANRRPDGCLTAVGYFRHRRLRAKVSASPAIPALLL